MTGLCALWAAVGLWYGLVFEWAAGDWFDRDPYSRVVDVLLILSSQFAAICVVFAVMCCWHGQRWWQQASDLRQRRPRMFAGEPIRVRRVRFRR